MEERVILLEMQFCNPIALSKVMEEMVNYHLVTYLESESLFKDLQFDFRRTIFIQSV